MVWVKFVAIYGPGHQAKKIIYKAFHEDKYVDDDIEEYAEHKLAREYDFDWTCYSIDYEKIEKPPIEAVQEMIADEESAISYAKDRIKLLKAYL